MILRIAKYFLFAWFFLVGTAARCQDFEEAGGGSIGDRIFVGGSLGLQFGDQTFVDISPLVGYNITERLAAGIGGTYIYYKDKRQYLYGNNLYQLEYETNIYGGRVFSRYYLVQELFAHAEYEILNLERPDDLNYGKFIRVNVPSMFLGGGYRQMLGQRSALELVLLYNVIEETYSPYANPVIRIGFVAGF